MSKTVIVTTCSANHLAQAKGMADSARKFNPGYEVMIGLVDRLEGRVEPAFYAPHDILEAHAMELPVFEAMRERYDVFELNCALKSFFAEAALKKYHADKIIFLDSDMLVFDSLQYIEEELERHSVLLTPHIWSPIPMDNKRPYEREMLKNGIYNAGFFALKNDQGGHAFLDWWKERMVEQCYVDLKHGMFVDQKWLNLAPIYFNQVKLLDHAGCNIAYWNLHERMVSKRDGKFFVNDQPLLFYHYSGYSMDTPGLISRHQDRTNMDDHPALKELFTIYQDALVKNNHAGMLKLECFYKKRPSLLKRLFG